MGLVYKSLAVIGVVAILAVAILAFMGGYTDPCDNVFEKHHGPGRACPALQKGPYNQLLVRIIAGTVQAAAVSIIPFILFVIFLNSLPGPT
jgi:hypothetical protein